MTRVNLLLLLALLVSALLLVRTAYDARHLYAEIDRAEREERQLTAELQRLDAERQQQATHMRVVKLAHERLRMRLATAQVTQYAQDPGAPAPAAALPGAGQ
jgi:cell division protein FtsL